MLLDEDVEADVLTILDCCFAGNGHKTPAIGLASRKNRDSNRICDLLTACDRDKYTPAPGPNSFTNALINTLNRLLDEDPNQCILVTRLVKEINNWYGTDARLFDRLRKEDGRHVQLQPLSTRKKRLLPFKYEVAERAVVNLRFSLAERDLSQSAIEKWAQELISACNDGVIPIRRIDWIGMERNNPGERFRRVVEMISSDTNKPKERFRRAVKTVIENNKEGTGQVRKRTRSDEPSPGVAKRLLSEHSHAENPETSASKSRMVL